ncbi:hypothetical protein HanHA300_Chr09g0318611 [Helianthus annuus]|nr:hypothetical protein HanHA300_Chr09g0318611 [Helianthus annuus]KAJ0542424.1 hypothetical protein HanHA89_Chr09g0339571 [Helianthus annuus]KAJ0711472.1 hypothetical protein HanOQP8_Chr09g0324211 [Helianthus annuus]
MIGHIVILVRQNEIFLLDYTAFLHPVFNRRDQLYILFSKSINFTLRLFPIASMLDPTP